MEVHRELGSLPTFVRPVVTIGSFDGVHLGHRALLERIVQRAGAGGTSVVVTFDPHPRSVLLSSGNPVKLLSTTAEKIERIEAAGIDHLVIVNFDLAFAKQTAEEYLHDFLFGRFRPHTVVIGYDHRFGAGRTGDISLLRASAEAAGIAVEELDEQDVDELAVSSTRIRKALGASDITSATALLGYAYPLTGRVVRGQAIGRTIGFPTANIDLENEHKLLPADGVYAVFVHPLHRETAPLQGMLYIGERPSLKGPRPRSIEVNLLNFEGDLYGQLLRVEVVAHLRGDASFGSLEELRRQIERDRETTLELLSGA